MPHYITNGTLIDGTGAVPTPLAWLEIDNTRITRIVPRSRDEAPLPAGAADIVDASGLTVMPGLIDAHCHISYGVARAIEEQDLYGSAEYRAIRGVYHARSVLQAGVTSFSDPGGSWYVAVAVRDAIKAGLFPGPRISAAGRYLSNNVALTDYFPSWVGAPDSGVGVMARTREEMVNVVREQVKNGVDFIKVAASGENPILTPAGGSIASVPSFRAEELRVIVEEAHRLGRRVTAHARSGQSVVDCIEAGMDWIMHADCMNRQEADKLAASGIPCCPALTFMANIADWGHLAGCTQARIDRFKAYVDNAQKILSYAHEQGVTMMCGTDTGFAVTPYGEWHAREPELFVTMLGMSNLQAITCATRNAAIAVDPENVGTLEAGKLADILLIDGDPCADIKVLQDKSRIRAVYLGGAPVDLTPAKESIRWPWERSLAISQTELYRQTVQQAA
ncbi:Imidazolonepropionase [Achromobacter insuavis]|uniref:metal-dependent hydrolase family protein n=1 Tax=Achromobacter insuavis TaxID=1287735 RepID=UPI0014669BCC|nr:amidohydrolase family protein [Achromobacter insuavis]CAB3883414.1 Imidazolonepropionase [Achromobacter insuavis]